MRWIYLSPHMDDAVWSAGGLMYEQTQAGLPVEIWTVMSGVPDDAELSDFAKMLHQRWRTSSARETIRQRRAENEAAAGRLGAKPVYLDFLDCIYRHGPAGQALYTNTFGPPHNLETDLSAQMTGNLAERLRPEDVLVCPLALGGHVDHVMVRQAAERLGRVLLHAADVPYHLNRPHKLWLKTAGMKASVRQVSQAGLQAWLESAEAYTSQVETEFHSLDRMRSKITAYWAQQKGLRLWQAPRRSWQFWRVKDGEQGQ